MEAATLDPGDYDGTYKFIGNRLCLDLVNTISWPERKRRHDWLDRYSNLIAWAEQAGILNAREAADLLAAGAVDGDSAGRVLREVHRQRMVLRDVVFPLALGDAPSRAELDAFNDLVGPAASHRRLAPASLTWTWERVKEPEQITAPVVYDAAELIVGADRTRLGACPACGWLYYDTTRNRSRRWCDMADCGSRDKARSYYHRLHGRGTDPTSC